MAYKIEIEIFEDMGCAWVRRGKYKVGHKFNYPDDAGLLCPWLLSSMDAVLQALRFGGTLPWSYKGTPYEKVINKSGVTTEFIRCIDPASGLVAKLTRTYYTKRKKGSK